MAKPERPSSVPGTGALPGDGDGFLVTAGTGEGTYSYPIPLPAGPAGHSPRLVLHYSHRSGNDAWGAGWSLQVRRITRHLPCCTVEQGGERFFDGDREIVPGAGGASWCTPDTPFPRYHREGEGWLVEDKSGVVHEVGLNGAARVAHPGPGGRVGEWLLERSTAPGGGTIEYGWRHKEGFPYLSLVRYGTYLVRLHYEERPDRRHDGRAGFSRRLTLRCTTLDIVVRTGEGERLWGSYRFGYRVAPGSAVTQLASIRHSVGIDCHAEVRQRPLVSFRYRDFDSARHLLRWMESEGPPPPLLSEPDVTLVALDASPLPGVLVYRGGRHLYWPNRGVVWGEPRSLPCLPQGPAAKRPEFPGLVGDPPARPARFTGGTGGGAVVEWGDLLQGALPRDHAGAAGTGALNSVEALPFAGRRDGVCSHGAGHVGWYRPAPVPREVPDVDFSTPDVHLADLTGDGIKDLVRLQSGRVEYWPGLGGGRFGAKVAMANAPLLCRDERRDTLLFTDIDGDGCADLVHLSPKGLAIYQNQNGQRFADPVLVAALTSPLPGTLRAVQLEGRRGMGLVWNSRAQVGTGYVHFRFDQPQPPYLLERIEDDAGSTVEVSYCSVPLESRRDRELWKRWRGSLRLPMIVVGKTRTVNALSGKVEDMEYRYHPAHLEPGSREARGVDGAERTGSGAPGGEERTACRRLFSGGKRVAAGRNVALAAIIFAMIVLVGGILGIVARGKVTLAAPPVTYQPAPEEEPVAPPGARPAVPMAPKDLPRAP